MSLARPIRMLVFAVLTIGCGRPAAETNAPEATADKAEVAVDEEVAVDKAEVAADDVAAEDAVRAGPAAQTISFADDADPEPTTQVQAAPKRPPIPRFRLFGTRENDGPN